jgi:2-polyprenyl-3-methyl-5-hydroxy-6-metoxy-1,4-benzoquinol methylase
MKQETWPAEELEQVPNCPVCESTERALLYADLTDRVFGVAPGKWQLYSCTTCGSAWLDPRPSRVSIGRAYENYYTHVADNDVSVQSKSRLVRQLHSWINDYKNVHYGLMRSPAGSCGRWLVPLFPSLRAKADAECCYLARPPACGGRLLDVGFGNGGFLKLAGEMGWDAEGIDFDSEAVAVASAQGLNVRCVSVDELLEENEKYDVITITHVLEHVYEPAILLENLHRLLKPGGCLWLETPNIESNGMSRFGRNWRALEPPRHLILFNPRSLHMILEKVGFLNITQRWHGMVSLSIYTASDTIAAGCCARDAVPQLFPSFAAIFSELKEMIQPARREFLSITAYKSS